MLKKLLNGEISLVKTFWLYGVFGVLILSVIAKISDNMLQDKIGSIAVMQNYIKTLRFSKINTSVLSVTIFNIASVLTLVLYSLFMIVSVWKSSAEYDKSTSLVYISRFSIILMVFICLLITL